MNANLERLKALVTETNEVVANLNNETEDIKRSNQEERAIKFVSIRDFLMDCWEIAKEINPNIQVKLDITDVKRIGYDAEVWILFNTTNERRTKICFLSKYYSRNKHEQNREIDSGFNADTLWKVGSERQYDIFPYYFGVQNEFDFVDKWNQEEFEKRFAAEIEKAITEKASKANEKYQTAVNSSELLRRYLN